MISKLQNNLEQTELAVRANLEIDGSLWVELPKDVVKLEDVGRVIVGRGDEVWCKVFYQEDECTECHKEYQRLMGEEEDGKEQN